MADSKNKKLKLGISRGCFTKDDPDAAKSNDENDQDDEFLTDTKNEQLIIGQALSNEICLEVFSQHLTYDLFLVGNHQVIAFCITRALEDDVQVNEDIFDVYRYEYPGSEKSTGGLSYISKLRNAYKDNLTSKTYKLHIKKLKSDFVKYRVNNLYVKRLLNLTRDPSSKVEDIGAVSEKIDELVSKNAELEHRGFKTMAELNEEHDHEIKNRKTGNFGHTGFRFLNEHLTEGFAPKRVSVLAGRPGMCKSAFVCNSMLRMANNKIPNALFALEMDGCAMADRWNAVETGIPLTRLIKRDNLTKSELKIEERVKKLREDKPIYINDQTGKTLKDIRRDLKFIVEKYGVKVCFIDLFMKVAKPYGMSNKSTADQYTQMLNEVQVMARELNVHISLVVQIGRRVEERTDKRPKISDLKDSGGFEEVADLILLFYREAYYISKNVEEDFDVDLIEIIIGKQRQGGSGTVKAKFLGDITKIVKCDEDDEKLFNKMLQIMKPNRGKKKYVKRD